MATAAEITQVRVNTNEPDNTAPFTDDYLTALIDAYGVNEAEYKVWVAKRNSAAELVQISEGGSTRAQQQVFEHYSKIVSDYDAKRDSTVGEGRRAPRTREIIRG